MLLREIENNEENVGRCELFVIKSFHNTHLNALNM